MASEKDKKYISKKYLKYPAQSELKRNFEYARVI